MEMKLDTERISVEPSATLQGSVEKIIPSPHPSQPGKAQIAVERADRGYRNLRIENTLTDEHGDDVRLKKGARVEVTVAAERELPASARDKVSQRARRKKADLSLRGN